MRNLSVEDKAKYFDKIIMLFSAKAKEAENGLPKAAAFADSLDQYKGKPMPPAVVIQCVEQARRGGQVDGYMEAIEDVTTMVISGNN